MNKIKELKKKLKSMGLSAGAVKRMYKLLNPETSRKILCDACFVRAHASAKSQQYDLKVLKERVCPKCQKSIETFISTGSMP